MTVMSVMFGMQRPTVRLVGGTRTMSAPGVTAGGDVYFSGLSKRERELKKLFPNGTSFLHFCQRYLPDCQTLAPIYALSTNPAGAQLLADLIQVKRDGNYEVTFPGRPHLPVTIHPDELRIDSRHFNLPLDLSQEKPGEHFQSAHGDLGLRIIELAYAKLNKGMYPGKYKHIPGDGRALQLYSQYAPYHYNNAQVLRDITGWPTELITANPAKGRQLSKEFIRAGGSKISICDSFKEENQSYPEYLEEISQKLLQVAKSPERYIVTAQSIGRPQGFDVDGNPTSPEPVLYGFADNKKFVNKHHVYTIEAIYPKRRGMLLVNPHDTEKKVFYQTFDQFFQHFNGLTVVKVPKKLQGRLY